MGKDRQSLVPGNTGVVGGEIVCSAEKGSEGYDAELGELCISWQFPGSNPVVICVPVYGKNYYKGKGAKAKAKAHAENQKADMPPGAHIAADSPRGDNNSEIAARLSTAIAGAVGKGMTQKQADAITVEVKNEKSAKRKNGRVETQTRWFFRMLIPGAANVDGSAFGDQASKVKLRGYAPAKGAAAVGVGPPPPPYRPPIPFKPKWRRKTPWRGSGRRPFAKDNPCIDAVSKDKIRLGKEPSPEDERYLEPEGTNGWKKA